MNNIVRVGQGYDVHRLEVGRKLILAGVLIAFDKGLLGHSDADVVVHAVIDGLLGGAGLGDIGEHFPDSDPAYKDIDSGVLLGRTCEMIEAAGFVTVNVDVTVIAEKPKLSGYKQEMRENLAQMLHLENGAVNIKAKTNEGLGETGQGQAIACQSVVSLGSKSE